MTAWENADNIESILQFEDVVLNDIEYKLQKPYKLTNAFSEPYIDKIIVKWLNEPTVKSKFSTTIEKLIMVNENLDEETIAQLSWTYDLITK